jgi:hypothetical protein
LPAHLGPTFGGDLIEPRNMEPLADSLDRATQYAYVGDCVSRPELARGLSRWVSRSGALPPDLQVRVSGHDAPEFRARLEIRRGTQTVAVREFSDQRVECRQRPAVLSSALGLALENYLESARAPEPKPEAAPMAVPLRSFDKPVWRLQTYAGGWWGGPVA